LQRHPRPEVVHLEADLVDLDLRDVQVHVGLLVAQPGGLVGAVPRSGRRLLGAGRSDFLRRVVRHGPPLNIVGGTWRLAATVTPFEWGHRTKTAVHPPDRGLVPAVGPGSLRNAPGGRWPRWLRGSSRRRLRRPPRQPRPGSAAGGLRSGRGKPPAEPWSRHPPG